MGCDVMDGSFGVLSLVRRGNVSTEKNFLFSVLLGGNAMSIF